MKIKQTNILSYFGIQKQERIWDREKYSRYLEIWRNLYLGNLVNNFKLEFQKKYKIEEIKEFYPNKNKFDIEKAISITRELRWRKYPYDKQHWGHWLHSLSPYQGRLTPSFAHWLIRAFSSPDMVIFDPFCGSGTVPLEADFLNRKGIGNDLNPYAYLIAKGKFDRRPLEEHLNYLKEISEDVVFNNEPIDDIPDWIKAYFHEKTLKEIIFLNKKLEKEKQYFLRACLMGILHGNRPGYLSVYTGCIIPMKPRPKSHPKFRPDKDVPEYRPVIPRMAAKVMRMYSNKIKLETKGEILNEDARNLKSLKNDSIDVIISSPPYYDTLDYTNQNRVRLFFLGLNKKDQKVLKEKLIQDTQTYLNEMKKVGRELKRVLIPGGYIVYILGDVIKTNYTINTAQKIGEVYSDIGFEILDIINDEIPLNKVASRSRKKKFDRIIIMKNI
ncbi:MAG: DNA methyltransferase [Candidatus Helarchaeota archaeon]